MSRKDAPFLIPSIVAAASIAAPGTPQSVGAQRSQGATPGSPALLASPRTPQAQAGKGGGWKGDSLYHYFVYENKFRVCVTN